MTHIPHVIFKQMKISSFIGNDEINKIKISSSLDDV